MSMRSVPSHLELHIQSVLSGFQYSALRGRGLPRKISLSFCSLGYHKNKEQWCVLAGWFDGMATRLEAHPLVVRSLVSLSAGTGEQKSEARPTAPSRGRLVIGFPLHDQRISLEVERQEEGGSSLVCCVVLMIMALTQRFSPSALHIFTLLRCTLPCAFDPRRLVLNITMHRIIFMARNKTAIEFIELVAWPLLERMLERMGFD